ncbi:2-C-methyl-D-erythritol 4-phosphate cytidylyltransferase [Desulfurispirillum indicum S5]|uniref:2-C-methyl-D-erythritol 4-phosphate cytidylyltransferase n=1 Tax=Desulfurispirillum indicum (strain ATCC BAA-1389 / DSM 22839 / S5) TaxID=653733 RepID=E6W5T5_DESIS|nr:2-C-methyl-D-erythritol 4-phosphate cytidylyltransferase [Desulfurispirillum indicum]ADU67220.1 2-C-methyl-D-erythritol 4-phosphate cytidylyltransferase [Desulfurispirillum indicum S5]
MRIAIILAGGQGRRMGATLPKQYLELAGKPILQHTLETFVSFGFFDAYVLVRRPEDAPMVTSIVEQAQVPVPVTQVEGGAERADSVLAALRAIPHAGARVFIHDGVRPFVRREQVVRLEQMLSTYAGAILAVEAHDTIKVVVEPPLIQGTFDRRTIYHAQTPQAFVLETIRTALEKGTAGLTDDASALEREGLPVAVVLGDLRNIKITTPEDMAIAEAILKGF